MHWLLVALALVFLHWYTRHTMMEKKQEDLSHFDFDAAKQRELSKFLVKEMS